MKGRYRIMSEKIDYILGLDIGIASVGYGIIDYETRDIISTGANIFKEANAENNEGRRQSRGSRRLKRRRIHRLDRIKQLLEKHELLNMNNIPVSTNPYEVRVRGLSNELSEDELSICLLHLAKRRGIHNVEAIDEAKDKDNELSTKEQLRRNEEELETKYVCEIQLKRLSSGEKVRGEKNRFKTSDYEKEARKLLENQKTYHNYNDEFIGEYIKLLITRREYFEGPGQGSEYGWGEDPKAWYEMMMGRCTYFPDELRSVKYTYSSDLYNALNDLNNLVINRDENHKLDYHEKFHVIENVFKQKKSPTLKQIATEIGVREEDIQGYRITKTGKPEFTKFKLFHDIKTCSNNKDILENAEFLDKIGEILTINQTPTEVINDLQKLEQEFSKEELEKLSKLTGYTGTHRLSNKCIQLVLDELWHTDKNQMQIFSDLGLKPSKYKFEKMNTIPVTVIDEFILSPVVKRSMTQAIRMINRAVELYGVPKDIIIEMAREKNSSDKQKFIRESQKKGEKLNKRINEIIGEYGLEKAKSLREKIRLLDEQEGKCLYSLEAIPLEDLLRNSNHYEVDHIIPRSISFDNSLANKVLVKAEENANKENRTPYQYLNSSKAKISYKQFKQHILNISKSGGLISRKKRNYLLEERDISKFDIQKEFINRNLVDTRYATRELITLLKAYFNANELPVNVKSINGSFTNHLRHVWDFPKHRNQGYKHHAEDALIIANADFLFKDKSFLYKANEIMNRPTTEEKSLEMNVKAEDDYEEVFYRKSIAYKIKEFRDFKFNHMVDKKPNRQLINDTIYSTRKDEQGDELIVNTIKNLYSNDNQDIDKLKKLIFETPEKILMYKHDYKTFEKLKMIFEQYSDAKNPLAKYYEEENKYLTKYAKENNGPVVKSIKVLGKKLGAHKNISGKYEKSRNNVIQLSLKPFRLDLFKDENGYKFITIRYSDVVKKDSHYYIDHDLYKEYKVNKGITDEADFIHSIYSGDVLKIDDEVFRFVTVLDDQRNTIELNMVDILYSEYMELNKLKGTPRKRITIGKKIRDITKLTTDCLGNQYILGGNKQPQMIIKRGL